MKDSEAADERSAVSFAEDNIGLSSAATFDEVDCDTLTDAAAVQLVVTTCDRSS